MSVERARSLRKRMSPAEARLWSVLRLDPLREFHFRRQVALGRYYADFASHAARLVIEVDGGQHFEPQEIAYDEERSTFIASQGYRVLRVTAGDVLNRLPSVVEAILAATPTPPAFGWSLLAFIRSTGANDWLRQPATKSPQWGGSDD